MSEKVAQQHTPGPWTVTVEAGDEWWFGGGGGKQAVIYAAGKSHRAVMVGGGNDDEELANARLISAAPELLEALIGMCPGCKLGLEPIPGAKSGHLARSVTRIVENRGGFENAEWEAGDAIHEFPPGEYEGEDYPDGFWDECLLTPEARAAIAKVCVS